MSSMSTNFTSRSISNPQDEASWRKRNKADSRRQSDRFRSQCKGALKDGFKTRKAERKTKGVTGEIPQFLLFARAASIRDGARNISNNGGYELA